MREATPVMKNEIFDLCDSAYFRNFFNKSARKTIIKALALPAEREFREEVS
jgi:hypothetical protein